MSLNLPKSLDKFSHDDIVRILIELNPRFFRPDRGSWQQGIPDLEDPSRQVVEVALTKLRDAWGQCLYYHRSGATRIHLVLSPRHYLDYKTKESAFIKANPIPNVEVYVLPELLIKSFLVHKKPKDKVKKKVVHVPELGFIVTEEDKQKALKPKKQKKEAKKERLIDVETQYVVTDDDTTEPVLDAEKLTDEMRQFDLVPILSPLGCLSYITREGYEEGMKNPDAQVWRPLK